MESEYNYKEVWNYAMEQISQQYKELGQESEFKLWFNIEYIEDTIDTIKVSAPSEFMWNRMVEKGNIAKICDKIKEITGQQNISIVSVITNKVISNEPTPKTEISTPVAEKEENKVETKPEETKKETKKNTSKNITLNENFTFETFIPGEGSDFAYKAAQAVAEEPGVKYNPILFYGGVGLGKTHLMQAIGNKISELQNDSLKITYLQAESFANEYINSINSKTTEKFKSKYRNLDILLLDDIHFLVGKEGTQEELFYTFNAKKTKNAQMIFTCDRPITEIKGIKDRLRTRFSNGLCIDITPPNYETRRAILLKKLQLMNKTIPEDVIDFIAKNIETNVRDLESVLTRLIGYSELIEKSISIEIAQEQLRDIFSSPTAGNISIESIQKVVADNYQISVSDLKGKKRDKKFTVPRQIALFIAKEITEYTYSELGIEFGGRDHSTVMHSCDKIKELMTTDPTLNSKIKLLIREIKEFKK